MNPNPQKYIDELASNEELRLWKVNMEINVQNVLPESYNGLIQRISTELLKQGTPCYLTVKESAQLKAYWFEEYINNRELISF